MKIKTLNDLFDNPLENGIFRVMYNNGLSDLLNSLGYTEDYIQSLDCEYIYGKSGMKSLSSLLNGLLNQYVIDDNKRFVKTPKNIKVTYDVFLDEFTSKIVTNIISLHYYYKWIELHKTLTYDYDPLKPYDMSVITQTVDGLITKNTFKPDTTETVSHDTTDTLTKSGDNKYISTGTTDEETSRYSFNQSSVPSPTEKVTVTPDTTDTETRNTTDTTKKSGTDTTSVSGSNITDYNSNRTRDTSITRTGNIGNITIQELIDRQRSVVSYQILNIIYRDLDEVLTRAKYN